MRLYTRARLVLSCIVPCYLIVGFFLSSFLSMWKSGIHEDIRTRAELVSDELAILLARTRAEDLQGELATKVTSRSWLQKISILDTYGRVVASDGSPLGREGILTHHNQDPGRRKQILQATQPFYLPETAEYFRPFSISSRNYIILVGVDPAISQGRIWWAVRWLLPGWLIAGLMALLAALYGSRMTLEHLVSSLANQVNRVTDGKAVELLPVSEPALQPLADGLRRLFRSIEADRGRIGSLERNITETRDRATHGRQESERLLQQSEDALSLFREESRLLWERCGCGIVRLDPGLRIRAANGLARQWLSLGPHPDPADLPKGLCRIVESVNTASGLTPSHGTVVARHPFFGHERRMDATCIPLGTGEASRGKPMLVFLEEPVASKASESASTPLEGFLRLLKGSLISIGQEVHAIEKLRKGPERSQKTSRAITRLARAVRDVETLIGARRVDELLLQGAPDLSCPAAQLTPAVIQAARYLGISVEWGAGEGYDGYAPGLEDRILSIAPQLLDIVLRESFAVVSDLNSSQSLRLSVSGDREPLEFTVSPQEANGERRLFAQTLSGYLEKAREVRKSADLILLRIALIRKILEPAGGKLDVSADGQGLLLGVASTSKGPWNTEPRGPRDLARAFLAEAQRNSAHSPMTGRT